MWERLGKHHYQENTLLPNIQHESHNDDRDDDDDDDNIDIKYHNLIKKDDSKKNRPK